MQKSLLAVNNLLFTGINPACDHQGKAVLALHPSLKCISLSLLSLSVLLRLGASALPCPSAGIHSNPFSTATAPKLTQALAEEQENIPQTLSAAGKQTPPAHRTFPEHFPS